MAIDAVLPNLLILGEATQSLPLEVRQRADEIEWRKVAALCDVRETKLGPLHAAAVRLLDEGLEEGVPALR